MQRINKKNAFTLIELLVVISIIAVLMAVLMPALQKVREQGKAVVCSSRQKDIGLALNLYAQDWNGALPTANYKAGDTNYTRLPFKLKPYYDQKGKTSSELWAYEMYRCPTQPIELGAVGTYGYNTFYFQGLKFKDGTYVERNVSNIRDGANLPMLGCLSGKTYLNIGGTGGQQMTYSGPHPSALQYGYLGGEMTPATRSLVNDFGPAPNHGRNCNMLMGDFHVSAVNVCVDGEFPWTDHIGTMFHPSRNPSFYSK